METEVNYFISKNQLKLFEGSCKQSTFKGRHIYTSKSYDPNNQNHGWYSHPDGNSPECVFVMDNKQFRDFLERGLVTSPT